MLSFRGFWRRHKRKVLVTTGVLGGGYLLYKLYNAHTQRLADLEAELAREQESSDDLLKAKMQAHFESIQSIADTTTLPHVMHYLSSRIAEELDTTDITERLMQMKGKSPEKLELWDRLKVISFTRMVLSLWAMTMLSLYIRVQVNILGRHLYIDTARGFGSSLIVEDAELIDRDDQQKFLASSDYLSTYGMPSLILHIQAAAIEVLNGKQLTDRFNTAVLRDTIMQILDKFMGTGSPHHWVNYLMPEDARWAELATAFSSDSTVLPDVTKFEQLTLETRSVISSGEFGNIAEMALRAVVDTVVVDMGAQSGGDLSSGTPLAKVLARVAQMGPTLLGESSKFRQIILNVPEVELFFTLIYSQMQIS
ncbi:PREDICTED: peroxisome biogenesis protein 3-2 isoform X2 [Fragaria vesca subsp. vesca]|uniref:peroxisome biogenesis protein 3-2 isoform X2 n=1 Tax=Fragaria vesca subsp. vesca TaxID=101020 RepID=UPI0002C324F6|nr:PREDICTED: peroxisome biogenesis protein 3-2 isoform X2 [Fragaria vesca subsp. vesca]